MGCLYVFILSVELWKDHCEDSRGYRVTSQTFCHRRKSRPPGGFSIVARQPHDIKPKDGMATIGGKVSSTWWVVLGLICLLFFSDEVSSGLVHCCTIWDLGCESIQNTDTQRTIQRSSSWAISYPIQGLNGLLLFLLIFLLAAKCRLMGVSGLICLQPVGERKSQHPLFIIIIIIMMESITPPRNIHYNFIIGTLWRPRPSP